MDEFMGLLNIFPNPSVQRWVMIVLGSISISAGLVTAMIHHNKPG